MVKSIYHNPQARCLYRAISIYGCNALIAVGMIITGLEPAFGLDSSSTNSPRKIATKHFTSGQQAIQVGLDELKAGDLEASVAALTYAAANGQPLACRAMT
jgi:hypothetical protein